MMIRRTAGFLVTCMALWLAPAAIAQTTTSSTSTSTSSTTSTSTTSTTSTTLANPCTGQQCTAEAPVAYLAGAAGELRLDLGGSCWRSPTSATGMCTSFLLVEPTTALVVRSGETLSLRFATAMAPTSLSLSRNDVATPLVAGNPATFAADLPVGTHVVFFTTKWLQGDASYRIKLDVRAAAGPATPQPGTITLTG